MKILIATLLCLLTASCVGFPAAWLYRGHITTQEPGETRWLQSVDPYFETREACEAWLEKHEVRANEVDRTCIKYLVGPYKSRLLQQAPEIYSDITARISRGDSRQKVRSILGTPQYDVKNHRLEIYREIGKDINAIYLFPNPVFANDNSISYILVLYDEYDDVVDIDADIWNGLMPPYNYQITAGKYQIVNNRPFEDDSLHGPCITWLELLDKYCPSYPNSLAWDCRFILIMDECSTE